jgi:hypothetical protein
MTRSASPLLPALVGGFFVFASVGAALAQTPPAAMGGHAGGMMMMQHRGMAKGPTRPGQDAFGAIQEIVELLSADPATDWSKVNIEALRGHLIDMNEVTLNAQVASKPVEGGLEMVVTGAGRTSDAIQRMVPAHAQEVTQSGLNGWTARTEKLDGGVRLTVTAADAKEAARIRGLGFIGVMASGSHHQAHHLAMAKGELAHNH